jgi:hypothetical protein
MPLEIMVDTQRKKGCYEVVDSTIDDLQTTIEEIPELSKPISILNIVKYSKNLLQWQPCITLYLLRNKVLFLVTPKNATWSNNNIMKSYV